MATLLQIPAQRFSNRALSSPSIHQQNIEISRFRSSISSSKSARSRLRVKAVKEKVEEIKTPAAADEVTKKYGLEAGLWKIFTSKEENEGATESNKSKGDQAKELLTKYGGAYLATSITLSLISFGLCYALINAGVDVPALLQKVGISTNETGEKVGTFALAYAAHKAASPIRFPPTVALTPIVASWIGKKVDKEK
ncbi:FAM210B-like protein [Perilla frutescens var. hirtella]|uniref:FAM210B-like protein n=1 Tax=Perilla frutescens var. hirtella TaxID=608512 RepID=A0AAD4P506_PERFH|nr:FAM210B-like protein [Perilla frutescens var. hirtella]